MGASWRCRKQIRLTDDHGNDITGKLWNETIVHASCLSVGSKVIIENVITDDWNGRISINSTKKTTIQVARFM